MSSTRKLNDNPVHPPAQLGDRIPLRSIQNSFLGFPYSTSPGHKTSPCDVSFTMKDEMSHRKPNPLPLCAQRSSVTVISENHMKENVLNVVDHNPDDENMPSSPSWVHLELCRKSLIQIEDYESQLHEGDTKAVCASGMRSCDATGSTTTEPGDEVPDELCGSHVGYIALKSFICTGAEVEISDASRLSGKSILSFTKDQTCRSSMYTADDISDLKDLEDTVSYPCSGHQDHAYCLQKEGTGLHEEPPSPGLFVSSQSEINPAETGVQIFGPNNLEVHSEGMESITNVDECSPGPTSPQISQESVHVLKQELQDRSLKPMDQDAGPELFSLELSKIVGVSELQVALAMPSSPDLKSCCHGTDECVIGPTSSVVSSTPAPQVPSMGLQRTNSTHTNAMASSDSGLSVLQSTLCSSPSGCSQGMPDDFITLSTPKVRLVLLSPSGHLKKLAQNSALPQNQLTGCGLSGGEAFPATCTEGTSTEKHIGLLDVQTIDLRTMNLDSPVPRPQLNSTELSSMQGQLSIRESAPSKVKDTGEPAIPGMGPLQQQLLRMAELLVCTSGKLATCVAGPPAERRSAGTWTSPVQLTEHSVNTTGVFERQREVSVADASCSTDSLLWNLSPESLGSASRQELEQRLISTLIMVEVLSQQLSCARRQNQECGPGPSDLRDKLVQTDHTELNQVVLYKELYVKALEKINTLELDQESLKKLLQSMQDVRATMSAVSIETEEALTELNEISRIANEDRDSASKQMAQMKALYARWQEVLKRMGEKVRSCLQERDQMRQQMEEALTAKEAAFDVTEQLRSRSAARIAKLEQSLGSYVEVKEALRKTNVEQASLNKEYAESLQSATEVLEASSNRQNSLYEEMNRARHLLQKARPVLVEMHTRTAAALKEGRKWEMERDMAVKEKNRIQDELAQTVTNLEEATQQIGDLNLQMSIMSTEMSVLRQRLSDTEEERDELRMKSTEMSANVSSIQASYAFLQQTLADERGRMQQTLDEARETAERAAGLEATLGLSQQRVEELVQALKEREHQLDELQSLTEDQAQQLQHFQDVQKQLSAAREMNEFLQAENELSREQVAETESMLKSYLQSLRERNLECEDLKQGLYELQKERESLQEELDSTRDRARSMLLDMGETLVQACVDIALLHHRVRGLSLSLQGTVTAGKHDCPSEPPAEVPRCPAGSFVGTVMDAIANDEGQSPEKTAAGELSPEEGIGSESSAFTRLPPTTPKKEQEEEQANVQELLSGLGEAVSELSSTITQVQDLKQAKQGELERTITSLQGELQSLAHKHRCEADDLNEQIQRLQAQVDRDAVALQQKAQDEKTKKQLCMEMDQSTELLQQYRLENSELRREVSEVRLSLQQAEVEVQALREELSQGSSQSGHGLQALDDKIQLMKEVDKLKRNLAVTEESRCRLLERAKRHQTVYESNQNKLEKELQLLDQMIETVRKTLTSVPAVVQNCTELQRLVEYLG